MKIEFSPYFRVQERESVCTRRERVGESAYVLLYKKERERGELNKERKGDAEKILLLICPR